MSPHPTRVRQKIHILPSCRRKIAIVSKLAPPPPSRAGANMHLEYTHAGQALGEANKHPSFHIPAREPFLFISVHFSGRGLFTTRGRPGALLKVCCETDGSSRALRAAAPPGERCVPICGCVCRGLHLRFS